jgi:flavin reductase (DIM6/NTAB) family NADH-FMN oxidoreductase RutF
MEYDRSPPNGANPGPFAPNADTARAFRAALGQFATGVTLITIQGPKGPMGFTANSFSSLSLDPPLVLWSLAKSSQRYGPYIAAPHFAIHVLADDQADLIARFARNGAGFDGLAHDRSPQGVPLIAGALARFDCALHQVFDGGDHSIILGRVLLASQASGAPLVFCQGQMGGFAAP